jgi:L-ascorbate metabolism protein UlaG (beta-lactamase superfamily)
MKITWLGQAGLYIETEGLKIIVDPYLSNSVIKVNPRNWRRVPVEESFLNIEPDVLICTHNHLDHVDPETLPVYLGRGGSILCLAPEAAWLEMKKCGGTHNYVKFNRGSQWTEGKVRFYAVRAEHSDVHPIGVIIEAEGKRLYITGDTLYTTEIFDDVRSHGLLDAIFVPINGVGNNMNMVDAARFCEELSPRVAVPIHWGLFDELRGSDWQYAGAKVVPEYYQEIKI